MDAPGYVQLNERRRLVIQALGEAARLIGARETGSIAGSRRHPRWRFSGHKLHAGKPRLTDFRPWPYCKRGGLNGCKHGVRSGRDSGNPQAGLGLMGPADDLRLRVQELEQGIFKLLVLGEFKNGKSTLLNALLGSRVLPAKTTACTAIITMLVHGADRTVTVYEDGAGGPRRLSREAFLEEFRLTIQDVETIQRQRSLDRFRRVRYARMECEHPFCANGVRLIDSPGLGEQFSRTLLTLNFLPQAQAVIFVLNATRLFSEDERAFLHERLGKEGAPPVFFVVNRINQIDPEDAAETREYVQQMLSPYFADRHGPEVGSDARQVFFVDARGALEARLSGHPDPAVLEATGIPALERELERFLTSEERIAATLGSSVQLLGRTVAAARRQIEQERVALVQPLAELERRRLQAEARLQELELRREELERTILLFSEVIAGKLQADLRDYLAGMRANWSRDSREFIQLENVGFWSLLTSTFSEEQRQEIQVAIDSEIRRYLQAQLMAWADRAPGVIGADLQTLSGELNAQIETFELRMEQVAAGFATGISAAVPSEGPAFARTAQAALDRLGLNSGGLAGVFTSRGGKGDWGGFLERVLLEQAILAGLAMAFGPVGIPVYLLIEIVLMAIQADDKKRRLREALGPALFQSLRSRMPALQAEVAARVEEQFVGLAIRVTAALQAQIDDARANQEALLRQRREQHFSVEQETRRLEAIGARLEALLEMVGEAVYRRSLNLKELELLEVGVPG